MTSRRRGHEPQRRTAAEEDWAITPAPIPHDAASRPAGTAEGFSSSIVATGEPPPTPTASILTVDELACLLRVNRKTVYASFRAGKIPGGQRIGGTIRFSREAILRWLTEGQLVRDSRGGR